MSNLNSGDFTMGADPMEVAGIAMDSISMDKINEETSAAKMIERLRKKWEARDQGGDNASGLPMPKPEAMADSSSPKPESTVDWAKEQDRLMEEHRVRMSFLRDPSNKTLAPEIQRLENIFEVLVFRGRELAVAFKLQCQPKEFAASKETAAAEARANELRKIQVRSEYQLWYTAALALIKLVLPSRVDDFIGLYEYPAKRSKLTKVNFRIADVMRGHFTTEKIKTMFGDGNVVTAGWSTCSELVLTQCDILEAAAAFLTTSLRKIQQLAQKNLFNSELLEACELCKKGFNRAAGAMAGVILKRHLDSVMTAHSVALNKKNPSIYDYGQRLKDEDIVDTPAWSFIQRLGDLYNRCFMVEDAEPNNEEINELLLGVDKILKTVF